jgi:hypothetical protein
MRTDRVSVAVTIGSTIPKPDPDLQDYNPKRQMHARGSYHSQEALRYLEG